MSRSTLRSLMSGARKSKRTASDLVAAWLGGARLCGAPQGEGLRRRHSRWAWDKCLLLWLDTEKYTVQAQDVSGGGARLLVREELDVGQTIYISAADDQRGAMRIETRVIHVGAPDEDGAFPTGVEFVTLELLEDQR